MSIFLRRVRHQLSVFASNCVTRKFLIVIVCISHLKTETPSNLSCEAVQIWKHDRLADPMIKNRFSETEDPRTLQDDLYEAAGRELFRVVNFFHGFRVLAENRKNAALRDNSRAIVSAVERDRMV